ncbi:D-glycero-D-manno-heptose 1,7-bisphosphate phosphatase [Methylorubrum extorquens]|nr:D-glycero-D-manno-heptose 1,7-bisphosphate phosphatase [Methylorubrum extorquens]
MFAAGLARSLDIEIEIAVEGEPCGTGGALWQARDRLDDRFFLLNGDSWFDVNLLDLAALAQASGSVAALALRPLNETGRYGTVALESERVVRFMEPTSLAEPGLVNGGVYVIRKEILDALTPNCSLERDALMPLAAAGHLAGRPYDSFFLDIGVPEDFAKAQSTVPAAQTRGAVFLDRDGVLNEDLGYVGEVERFVWLPGAKKAIRRLNDLGFFVFLVTNQAGVARGFYGEADVAILHAHVQDELAAEGAHLDDIRYCPFHPDGTVARYARASDQRKPAPGMILDLLEHWPVGRHRSIMIGDQEHDATAGQNAGIMGYRLESGESLEMALAHLLPLLNGVVRRASQTDDASA